jgi:hypothetical protein
VGAEVIVTTDWIDAFGRDQRSLYLIFGVEAAERPVGAVPPDTIITKTVETVDNDRAAALMLGGGMP